MSFWEIAPWLLAPLALVLIGYLIYCKATGRDVPGWLKWLSYGLNVLAMLSVAAAQLFKAGQRSSPVPPDDLDPLVDPGTPHLDKAVKDREEAAEKAEEAGRHVREDITEDEVGSSFASEFGTGLKPPGCDSEEGGGM